ncbi:MAG: FtsX-like permease family protein [Chloroflexota bacterium]
MTTPTTHNLPLWRTAWRRLRRRPFQYVLFILGIALGVGMMVSIDLAGNSASRAFELSTDAVTGRATHRLVADTTGIDESLYTQLRVDLGYDLSAPVVEGYVLSEALGNQPMRLVGIDIFAEAPFRSYFASENPGEFDVAPILTVPNSIILSAPLAEQFGIAVGDEIDVSFAGDAATMVLVGLIDPANEVNGRALSSIIFTDISSAQTVLRLDGKLSHIDLIANDSSSLTAIESILPTGVRIEAASASSNTVQQMTAAFELNLQALSLLALVVGMFLIYNTVSFSVVQRRPLFGVLRCLGVTGGQLFRLILTEAAILGLIGSLLGLIIGVILGRGMVQLVTQTINDLYFVVNVQEVAIAPGSLIRGLVIGVVASLIASAVPAWEAMRTTPQSTLRRSTLENQTRRLLPWLVGAWAVIGSLGAFLLWLNGVSLFVAFGGLFGILVAFALLTPPVTTIIMQWLTPIGYRLFGVVGRMAPRDIDRSLSRTSVAIAALMTAVSVIVGVSIMIGSFRQTVSEWLNQTLQADVFISPPSLTASTINGTLQPDVLSTVSEIEGVGSIVTARQIQVQLPSTERSVALVASNGDVSGGERPYLWIDDNYDAAWARFRAGEGVFITEPLLRKENMSIPPEPITFMTPDGLQTFDVLGVSFDYANEQGSIVIWDDTFRSIWPDDEISTMAVFAIPGTDIDALADTIQAQFEGRSDVIIQSNQSIRNNALEIFDRTFAITGALQLLAVVVAFIGVLSALMSLQLERTRELGVLRATGMTIRQLWQLTLLETGLMGGVAGLLALPTGFILAWVLIFVINVRSFGWTLQMHLTTTDFLQAFIVAIAAALLAGIYPASRLGKLVIASAVRSE